MKPGMKLVQYQGSRCWGSGVGGRVCDQDGEEEAYKFSVQYRQWTVPWRAKASIMLIASYVFLPACKTS